MLSEIAKENESSDTTGGEERTTLAEPSVQETKRKISFTHKGQEFRQDQARRKRKMEFRMLRKTIDKFMDSLALEAGAIVLRRNKHELEVRFVECERSHKELVALLQEEDEVKEADADFLDEQERYERTIAIANTRISRLESDPGERSSSSSRSSRSTRSSRSHYSSTSVKRLETATKKAALEAELIFADAEAKLQVEMASTQAQLKKIELERELAKATAEDHVQSRFELNVESEDGSRSLPLVMKHEPEKVNDFPVSNTSGHLGALDAKATPFIPSTPINRAVSSFPEQQETRSSAPTYSCAALAQHQVLVRNTDVRDFGCQSTLVATNPDRSKVDAVTQGSSPIITPRNLPSLPVEEPDVFYGDPEQFPIWIRNFDDLIERHVQNPSRRLRYLGKYTDGPAKKAIEGLIGLTTESAYREAKSQLELWFGDPATITREYKKRLRTWPLIASNDGGKSLREFAHYLHNCNFLVETSSYMNSLDDEDLNQTLTLKLPKGMRDAWSWEVSKYKGKTLNKKYPPFSVFCEYVMNQALVFNQPVIGIGVLDQMVYEKRKLNAPSRASKSYSKPARCLATHLTNDDSRSTQKKPDKSLMVLACPFCQQQHGLERCPDFIKKGNVGMVDFIKANGICFACLRKGHRSRYCRQRMKCDICGASHPTILHLDGFVKNKSEEVKTSDESASGASCLMVMSQVSSRSTRALPVKLHHMCDPKKEVCVYALLDEQSDVSFVTNDVQRALRVDASPVTLKLSTMGTTSTLNACKIKGLRVQGYQGPAVELPPCYTTDSIPVEFNQIVQKKTAEKHPVFCQLSAEIPEYDPEVKVGLLIGRDCIRALYPLEIVRDPQSLSYAVRTIIGWSIVGVQSDPPHVREDVRICHRTMACVMQKHMPASIQTKELISPRDILNSLERDFNEYRPAARLDYPSKPLSMDDKRFLRICKEGIQKTNDSHYVLPLPFREHDIDLPNNRSLALRRLQAVGRRMNSDLGYARSYSEFMNELIEKRYAEEFDDHEVMPGHVWYMAHHGVFHPHKNKIRVVFDASAEYQNESLNKHLLAGPCLTNSLVGVLVRYRKGYYGFVGDIEKMFYQVRLQENQRDFFRFLWYKDGDTSQKPTEYRMNVHGFGAVSSPGCCNYALKKTADDHESDLGAKAAYFVRRNFYVDDAVGCADTVDEAISLIRSVKEMCSRGGFNLTKFVSNEPKVLEALEEKDRSAKFKDMDLGSDTLPIMRTLGIEWSLQDDSFLFRISIKDRPLTRRGILSTVCSIFDPLGFIAPVVLEGKKILQELCIGQYDWDQVIEGNLKERWLKWVSELPELAHLNVRRCYKPDEFGEIVKAELHYFSDGSSQAYGQCTYLRLIDNDGKIHCSFVMGKARVAPLKSITIPRMELTAALVAVRIGAMLLEELELENITETFWTDSQVVLGYIANDARRFHVYVANRVQEIRDRTDPSQWFYVSSPENPADDCSRGLRPRDMVSKKCRYLNGPDFLWQPLTHRLQNPNDFNQLNNSDSEVRTVTLCTQIKEPSYPSLLERISTISLWYKAVKVIAWFRRGMNNLLSRMKPKKSVTADFPSGLRLTVQELEDAKTCIVRLVQNNAFTKEICALREFGKNLDESDRHFIRRKNVALRKASGLFRLQPYLDCDDVLRVGGRLELSGLPHELKHPVILPKTGIVTSMIIRHFHEIVKHQGRGITHSAIREAGFWIVGGVSLISNVISTCITCRRLRGKPIDQRMADLPKDRLEPAPPFSYCAVDLFGPFIIKEKRKELKRYGVLFTCLNSRAIRIEIAPSLHTDSFINALRRFICRNGPVRQIRCDMGTNITAASRELREAYEALDENKLSEFLLKENCDFFPFKFNVPSASYQGGVWERQIRSARAVLSAILSKHGSQLDEDCLSTFMAEAEAIVNCRPLTVENLSSVDGPLPLTPSQLLTSKTGLVLPPPGPFGNPDLYLRKRWRRVQHLANEYWQRWRKEFLSSLQPRQKWNKLRPSLRVNDLVLIVDEGLPRNSWRLARITKVYPEEDGLVRKAQCLVGDPTLDNMGKRQRKSLFLDRPIQKLVLFLRANKIPDSEG